MDWRTLYLNSFSNPFITEETRINTETPRATPTKPAEDTKDKKPDLLPLKYLIAINSGKEDITVKRFLFLA